MTVKEIVVSYLKQNGYDGLCYSCGEVVCGCRLDRGISPCDCMDETCQPGYHHADGLMYPAKENTDAR